MAAIDWPSALPDKPEADGYRRAEVDKRVVFEPESGEPKRRPRTSRRSWLHEIVLIIPDDLVALLDEFWNDTGQGVLPFNYPRDPFTDQVNVEMRFESPIEWSPSGEVGNNGRPSWRASFVLRRSI
jgi:hypothetical protein